MGPEASGGQVASGAMEGGIEAASGLDATVPADERNRSTVT